MKTIKLELSTEETMALATAMSIAAEIKNGRVDAAGKCAVAYKLMVGRDTSNSLINKVQAVTAEAMTELGHHEAAAIMRDRASAGVGNLRSLPDTLFAEDDGKPTEGG